MILDLDEFITRERPAWTELEQVLADHDTHPDSEMSFDEVQRFHYLYQRASSDLEKMNTFAAHAEMQAWLENHVARAYAKMHEERGSGARFSVWRWLKSGCPGTVRRRWRACALAVSICLVGALLGASISVVNPEAKTDLLGGFAALAGDPSERVAMEEREDFDLFSGRQSFASQLMVNNIRVTFLAMAMGISWGVVTAIIMFQNGVILGIVCCDYVRAGEGEFLLAWLLPHGSFELPAVFLGGAAGLVLARAIFGWGTDLVLRDRLRRVMPDMLTLAVGAALLLVWAGLVESFLSQYHRPDLYPWKIALGSVQLGGLMLYLAFSGREKVSDLSGGALR